MNIFSSIFYISLSSNVSAFLPISSFLSFSLNLSFSLFACAFSFPYFLPPPISTSSFFLSFELIPSLPPSLSSSLSLPDSSLFSLFRFSSFSSHIFGQVYLTYSHISLLSLSLSSLLHKKTPITLLNVLFSLSCLLINFLSNIVSPLIFVSLSSIFPLILPKIIFSLFHILSLCPSIIFFPSIDFLFFLIFSGHPLPFSLFKFLFSLDLTPLNYFICFISLYLSAHLILSPILLSLLAQLSLLLFFSCLDPSPSLFLTISLQILSLLILLFLSNSLLAGSFSYSPNCLL